MKEYLTTVAITIGVAIAGALIITVLFGHQRGAAPAHKAAVDTTVGGNGGMKP